MAISDYSEPSIESDGELAGDAAFGGEVDWHPYSWDLMQLWDGLQYPPEDLMNPGESYRQAREQTRIYEECGRIHLFRDGERVNSLEESDDGYRSVRSDLSLDDVPDRDLDEMNKVDVADLVGCHVNTVSRIENREETSNKGISRDYERRMAGVLQIPDYFELSHIDRSKHYTRGMVIQELRSEARAREGVLKLEHLEESDRYSLMTAARTNLFDTWNMAKDAAGLDVISRNQGGRNFSKPNETDFFSKIDSAESAYWLGMIMADGNMSSGQNSYGVQISQKASSIGILRQFQEALGIHNKITVYPTDNHQVIMGRDVECDDIAKLNFASKHIHNDLTRLGLGPNKSHELQWPDNPEIAGEAIPEEYVPDLVRGLFDGDGSISVCEKPSGRRNLVWTMHGNPPVLREVGERIEAEVGPKLTRSRINTIEDRRSIKYSGNNAVPEIMSWMYQNVKTGEDPFMLRKLSTLIDHRPNYQTSGNGTQLEEVKEELEDVRDQKSEYWGDIEQILEDEKVEDKTAGYV